SWPVSTLQILTTLSSAPLASHLPSGLTAMQTTPPRLNLSAESVISSRQLFVSQTLIVLSQLPLTRRFPSGQYARLVTDLVCAFTVRTSEFVCNSHTFTFSLLAVANRLPSGLNAALRTGLNTSNMITSCPVSAFQIFTDLSLLA